MDEAATANNEGGAEVENESDCEGLFAVMLEKTVFARWCEIKMAEGFVTDSQIACLLFQRYGSREGELWHAECLHCQSPLAVSLVCGSCQTLAPRYVTTHAGAASRTGSVSGISKANVTSTQQQASQGQVTLDPRETGVMVTGMKAKDGGVQMQHRTEALSPYEGLEEKEDNRGAYSDGEDYDGDTDVDSLCAEPQLPEHSKSAKCINSTIDLKPISKGEVSDCGKLNLVEKSSYKCEQCSKICHSLNILLAHMEKEHGMKDNQSVMYEMLEKEEGVLFQCRECGKTFPTRGRVQSHAVSHSSVMPHCCEFCDRQFKLSSALRVHKINVHSGVKPFKCDQCDAAYAFNSDLTVHKRMHKEERPFVCCDCGLAYKKSNHLSGHRKRVHGSTKLTQSQQLLRCEICQKTFKFKSSWKLHMRCHNKKMQSCLKGNIAYSEKRELTEPMKANDACHTCAKCGHFFSTEILLQGHMQVHSEEKSFACIHCSKNFKFKRDLFAHRKTEHWRTTQKENPYKCEQCDSSFRYKTELTKHKRIHKDERPHACGECGAKFKRSAHLRMHENGHEDMRNAVCHICGKCCLGLKSLAMHIKMRHNIDHMVEKPYKCLDCTAAFTLLSQLTSHRGVHMQQHPFVCDHCGRAFRTEHTLTIHVRKHTGEKPFKCNKCQEAFIDKCALKRHEIQHSPQSKELCHVCGASFPTKAHLAVHIQRHSADRPYKCSQCGKGYKTTSDLNKHMMFHSDDKPFQCSFCPYAFHTKAMLNKHLRKHTGERPYKCEQCSATFAYFSSLAAHRKLHSNNKPFICDICNASFFTAYNLRLHSRKHSGERPYQCHLCTESFSWHSGLKCHLKKHQPHTV